MKHLQDTNALEPLDKPTNKINVSELFNIETNLEVDGDQGSTGFNIINYVRVYSKPVLHVSPRKFWF